MEGHIWVWITWHTVLNMTFFPHNLTIIILIIYLLQFSIILLSNLETPFFRRLLLTALLIFFYLCHNYLKILPSTNSFLLIPTL
jgi:hypothetical protein